MPDVTPAAPVNPLKPAPKAEPVPTQVSAGTATEAKVEGQPPAQDAKVAADKERRAAAAARARREEARFLLERQSFKAEQEKWKREQEETQRANANAVARLAEGQRLAKEDPDKFLDWAGVKFEDIAKRKIQGDKRNPAELIAAEVAKLEAKMRAERQEIDAKRQAQQQEEATKSFIEQSQKQIKHLMEQKPDDFELCNAEGNGHEQAWKLIEKTYEKHCDPATGALRANAPKDILDLFNPMNQAQLFTFALEAVESDLVEKNYKRLSNSKKIQARIKAEEEKLAAGKLEKEKAEAEKLAAKGITKTGFYRKQSSPSPTEPAQQRRPRMLSRSERVAQAAKLLASQKTAQQ
jgi:hypothetical protein